MGKKNSRHSCVDSKTGRWHKQVVRGHWGQCSQGVMSFIENSWLAGGCACVYIYRAVDGVDAAAGITMSIFLNVSASFCFQIHVSTQM